MCHPDGERDGSDREQHHHQLHRPADKQAVNLRPVQRSPSDRVKANGGGIFIQPFEQSGASGRVREHMNP